MFLVVLVVGGWAIYTIRSNPLLLFPKRRRAPHHEAGVVQLPAEKVAAAGIHSETVGQRPLRMTRTVPGRIQYDDTRHIAVKAATAGTLIDVKVKPAMRFSPGQCLAILSSPEVGKARPRSCSSRKSSRSSRQNWSGRRIAKRSADSGQSDPRASDD